MIERDTELQNSTETAINYTRCYKPYLFDCQFKVKYFENK